MGEDPYLPTTILVVINFLQWCREKYGLFYSSINSIKSALQIYVTVQGKKLSEFDLLSDYMKGVLNESPTLPRYQNIWDPAIVLNHVSGWGQAFELSLKQLAQKLLILLLLCSGQRLQTIYQFNLDHLNFTQEGFCFQILKKLKRSKVGTLVSYKAYHQNPSLCPQQHLMQYLHVTERLREDRQLFLSFQQPYKAVQQSTLSRWVSEVLQSAGIDVSVFKPHSTRSASSSGAARGGAKIDTIMAAGGWTTSSTFTDWYQRPVCTQNFQSAVYQAARV